MNRVTATALKRINQGLHSLIQAKKQNTKITSVGAATSNRLVDRKKNVLPTIFFFLINSFFQSFCKEKYHKHLLFRLLKWRHVLLLLFVISDSKCQRPFLGLWTVAQTKGAKFPTFTHSTDWTINRCIMKKPWMNPQWQQLLTEALTRFVQGRELIRGYCW